VKLVKATLTLSTIIV